MNKRKKHNREYWAELLGRTEDDGECRALAARAAREGLGIVPADVGRLAECNNTYGVLPRYYIDRPYVCRCCGSRQVWTAAQQQWWYETLGQHIDSDAVECQSCRYERRKRDGVQLLSRLTEEARLLGREAFRPCKLQQGAWVEAMNSKWWGVRVAAIQSLGCWWGSSRAPEALHALQSLAAGGGSSYNSWQYLAARTALKAMAVQLRAGDAKWILDWLLHEKAVDDVYVSVLVWYLPVSEVLAVLVTPRWLTRAHCDAEQAARVLYIFAAVNETSPDCDVGLWMRLARHYLASPLIGGLACDYLHYRLERLSALQDSAAVRRKNKVKSARKKA